MSACVTVYESSNIWAIRRSDLIQTLDIWTSQCANVKYRGKCKVYLVSWEPNFPLFSGKPHITLREKSERERKRQKRDQRK